MNLKEAMKAALDGHKFRCTGWPKGSFVRWEAHRFIDETNTWWAPLTSDIDSSWEIVSEPVKYSVDVWLENTPEKSTAGDIGMYVFGKYGEWRSNKHPKCKKYRVTVEEVEE